MIGWLGASRQMSRATTTAALGMLPFMVIDSRSARSSVIRAVPLISSTRVSPGHIARSATSGSSTTLWYVSVRRLPRRSGIAIVERSRMRTNPGGSPFGLASAWPAPSWDAMTTRGEALRNSDIVSSRPSLSVASPAGVRGGAECCRQNSERMMALAQCTKASLTTSVLGDFASVSPLTRRVSPHPGIKNSVENGVPGATLGERGRPSRVAVSIVAKPLEPPMTPARRAP